MKGEQWEGGGQKRDDGSGGGEEDVAGLWRMAMVEYRYVPLGY